MNGLNILLDIIDRF